MCKTADLLLSVGEDCCEEWGEELCGEVDVVVSKGEMKYCSVPGISFSMTVVRSAREVEQGENLAECRGGDSRCSCAAEARAVGGSAGFSVSRCPQDKVPQRFVEQNIEQSTREQILDVPMPLIKEPLVEVPRSVSPDKILQRAREQTLDFDVPLRQAEEEVFSRRRFNSVWLSRL